VPLHGQKWQRGGDEQNYCLNRLSHGPLPSDELRPDKQSIRVHRPESILFSSCRWIEQQLARFKLYRLMERSIHQDLPEHFAHGAGLA
jgi:hypothetical protein